MTTLELCELAELKEAARKLSQPDLPARAFIKQLAGNGLSQEAIASIAQALPRRACISWGLNSIRRVSAACAGLHTEVALRAVELWLAEPKDELRRVAFEAGSKAGQSTPVGCLTMAVFFSGGSMAPATAPVAPIEPAPHICGKTIAVALAAAVALDPRNAVELRGAFIDQGLHLADQLKIWEQEK